MNFESRIANRYMRHHFFDRTIGQTRRFQKYHINFRRGFLNFRLDFANGVNDFFVRQIAFQIDGRIKQNLLRRETRLRPVSIRSTVSMTPGCELIACRIVSIIILFIAIFLKNYLNFFF